MDYRGKKSKSIKLNTIFKTLMSIVNIVFPLLTVPYVARVLSMDGYTEYNKAVSMITWFSPFAVFGVYTYGMRSVSQTRQNKEECERLFSKLFFFNVFTSFFTFITFILIVFFFPTFQEYKLLYVIVSLQLLFSCFSTDWFNEALEEYGFILVKTFFLKILYVLLVFVFVRKTTDTFVYAILTSISVIANSLMTFFYAKKTVRFVRIPISDGIKLVRPLFIIFLLVNSSMLFTIFDRFVLVWFTDKLQLTYYTISQTIVIAIINVTSSVVLVSIPRLSHLWSNNKEDEYYRIVNKSSSVFLALQTPCCIGIALLSQEIMWFYSGNNYLLGSTVLCLFSLRCYLYAFDIIQAKQVLLATSHEKKLIKIYYIAGIYNVVLKIILISTNNVSPEMCVITTGTADLLVLFLEYREIKKNSCSF